MTSATVPRLGKRALVPLAVVVVVVGMAVGGCATSRPVKFEQPTYSVPKAEVAQTHDVSLMVVLDAATLAQKYTVRSWITGYANKWEIEPGEMLKDVVLLEFPQAFGQTEIASEYREPNSGNRKLTLQLTIASFVFADFHATADVRAVAYQSGQELVFDKTYHAEGFTQSNKMVFGGAFAMKSAIRQSSLDAYKKIFVELRNDVARALTSLP